MIAHNSWKFYVIFLWPYNQDASIDAKFTYCLRETTLFFLLMTILCCLPWLLFDFEFQYYNINYYFLNDQPWQVRYQMRAHSPGKVEVIFIRPYIHYLLP